MRMLVLGAGLQGSACAYDLLQDKEVTEVRLADLHVGHLPEFLAPFSGPRLLPTPLDVRDRDAVLGAMRECDAVMSAIPYYFNYELAQLAVEAGVHFCDLGGNTEIVFKQKELDAEAQAQEHHRRSGLRSRAGHGEHPRRVRHLAARHGELGARSSSADLPQHPEPPLNYMLVYSLEGALDYYTTLSWVLRDGKRTQVKALSEREPVEFETPLGELEAFHTAGGLSTMAFRYEGKIPTMEYKTLRYPGHAKIMEDIRELGLLDLDAGRREGNEGHSARRVHRERAARSSPSRRDAISSRCASSSPARRAASRPSEASISSIEYDEKHDISAMMRTTGYSLSITGLMQVRGEVKPAGVHTPDECIPAKAYIDELRKRGIDIKES